MGWRSVQIKFFVSVVSVVLAALNALSESEPARKVGEYMDAQLKTNHFSGAVLIAKNGKVIMATGYGMASVERKAPNAPGTRFRLGPISHQFTAMAILELQNAGKLSVHDSVCKYISGCPKNWQEITIVNLLTHTSGIPDLADQGDSTASPMTVPELVSCYKDKSLAFKPGTDLKFSSVGYDLLGAVIENVSAQHYQSYLAKHIFKPLGMKDTGNYDRGAAVDSVRALGYRQDGDRNVLANDTCSEISGSCNGGLYSTVADLYRWDRALYSTRLLPQESLSAMFIPYQDGYGFGWRVLREFERKVLTYSGKSNGFASSIRRYPDDDACVIVLSNLESVNAERMTHDLGAILFGMHYELPIAPRAVQ